MSKNNKDRIDLVIVSASENVRYDEYSNMPIDRVDLYMNLVQLRMLYFEGGFRSHLDILNKVVYGKYFHEANYEDRRKLLSIWNLHTLNGLLAINLLANEGIECKIINNFDAEFDILCEYCSRMEQPIIAISTTFILQWAEIGRIVKKIRERLPEVELILGGAFIHDQFLSGGVEIFERPMQKYNIQYVLYAYNSEADLLKLFKMVKEKKRATIESVDNLLFLNHAGQVNYTDTINHEPVLKIYPSSWKILSDSVRNNIVQIRTASGCPFRCLFCSYPSTAGGFFYSSVENVKNHLDAIVEIGGVNKVVFIDDTFNVPKERFYQIVKLLKKYPFDWFAFLRVQFIDEELAVHMSESGCEGVYLGLESGSDLILSNMNKQTTKLMYQKGIDALKKCNIQTLASFIVGFPGETRNTVQDTISFISQSGLDYYSLKELYYLNNSPLFFKNKEFGIEGQGNKWKHGTMTSSEASEMRLYMFENIKNVLHVDPDMGLWYLIFLRSRGFEWGQIKEYQHIIDQMTRQENMGVYMEKDGFIKRIQMFLGNGLYEKVPIKLKKTYKDCDI